MAETSRGSPLPTSLDPKSPFLSQLSESRDPHLMRPTFECFVMERGPRFGEYSALREKKLRMKYLQSPEKENHEKPLNRTILTPPRKQVKFSPNFSTPPRRSKCTSPLIQSVPDFSSALRKENRRPTAKATGKSLTPPLPLVPSKTMRVNGSGKMGIGSNSADKSASLMTRKSYANMEEFRGFANAAINAENGTKSGRGSCRTSLGQYY